MLKSNEKINIAKKNQNDDQSLANGASTGNMFHAAEKGNEDSEPAGEANAVT